MSSFFARAVLAVMLWIPVSLAAADFSIREAASRLEGGVYLVDAIVDFEFSETALEALDNGVPLTLVVEVRIQREDAWFWNRNLVSRKVRYEIRYHALSGLYEISDAETGVQERFATRQAAMAKLGELHNIEVAHADELAEGRRYRMALRAFLDIESLPLPLRPLAYISPQWHLGTGWEKWRLDH